MLVLCELWCIFTVLIRKKRNNVLTTSKTQSKEVESHQETITGAEV